MSSHAFLQPVTAGIGNWGWDFAQLVTAGMGVNGLIGPLEYKYLVMFVIYEVQLDKYRILHDRAWI